MLVISQVSFGQDVYARTECGPEILPPARRSHPPAHRLAGLRRSLARVLALTGGIAVALTLAWGISTRIQGQAAGGPAASGSNQGGTFTPPRTAWGDPDLQGQWNSQTSTPLERPLTGALAQKETLTDEEAEDLEAAHRAAGDRPPAAGDPGTYNSFWFDPGKGLNRTSLIIDPPDGRVPAYTPEAEARLAAQRADRATRGPAD